MTWLDLEEGILEEFAERASSRIERDEFKSGFGRNIWEDIVGQHQRRVKRMKARGVCCNCGKPSDRPGKWYCLACAKSLRERRRKAPAVPAKKTCQEKTDVVCAKVSVRVKPLVVRELTRRCESPACCNHVVRDRPKHVSALGMGQPAKYCSPRCSQYVRNQKRNTLTRAGSVQ